MKKKVLLIDDHDDFRAILKDYLNQQDLDLVIFEANSAAMGSIKASCVKPDIILMDISLPNPSGLETVRQIIKDLPRCAIIILTLFDVAVFKKLTKRIKVKAFIGKNEVYEKLLPLIKKCL